MSAAKKDSRVVFITGANRGIGRETARELGELGLTVVIGARDLAKGEAAAAELRARGLAVEAILCDVRRPETVRGVFDYFDKKYGRLDILINNAAIHPGIPTANLASMIAPDLLRDIFETNFIAVVALTQALLPLLRKAPSGRILNLSSIVGSLTMQTRPNSPIEDAKDLGYNASKTALNAFTIHLAHELRETSIKVFSVDPGWVKTSMGGPRATLEVSAGGQSSAQVAMLPDDVPSGGFFRGAEAIPW
jgi:NAD(P)-dependent dehydrogenase (short-subunit alcohol dehydrogenase family)